MTIMDLLLATDAQAGQRVLYNGNTPKRNEANNIFSASTSRRHLAIGSSFWPGS